MVYSLHNVCCVVIIRNVVKSTMSNTYQKVTVLFIRTSPCYNYILVSFINNDSLERKVPVYSCMKHLQIEYKGVRGIEKGLSAALSILHNCTSHFSCFSLGIQYDLLKLPGQFHTVTTPLKKENKCIN